MRRRPTRRRGRGRRWPLRVREFVVGSCITQQVHLAAVAVLQPSLQEPHQTADSHAGLRPFWLADPESALSDGARPTASYPVKGAPQSQKPGERVTPAATIGRKGGESCCRVGDSGVPWQQQLTGVAG